MKNNKRLDVLGALKHWDLVDYINDIHYYLASKNQNKLIACIVSPHDGNGFKWLLRVANFEDFDRWSLAEMQKYCSTFEDVIDILTSLDVEQKLKDPTED